MCPPCNVRRLGLARVAAAPVHQVVDVDQHVARAQLDLLAAGNWDAAVLHQAAVLGLAVDPRVAARNDPKHAVVVQRNVPLHVAWPVFHQAVLHRLHRPHIDGVDVGGATAPVHSRRWGLHIICIALTPACSSWRSSVARPRIGSETQNSTASAVSASMNVSVLPRRGCGAVSQRPPGGSLRRPVPPPDRLLPLKQRPRRSRAATPVHPAGITSRLTRYPSRISCARLLDDIGLTPERRQDLRHGGTRTALSASRSGIGGRPG